MAIWRQCFDLRPEAGRRPFSTFVCMCLNVWMWAILQARVESPLVTSQPIFVKIFKRTDTPKRTRPDLTTLLQKASVLLSPSPAICGLQNLYFSVFLIFCDIYVVVMHILKIRSGVITRDLDRDSKHSCCYFIYIIVIKISNVTIINHLFTN